MAPHHCTHLHRHLSNWLRVGLLHLRGRELAGVLALGHALSAALVSRVADLWPAGDLYS